MNFRNARPSDAASVAKIYNQGIVERSSTFETTLRTPEDMLIRFEDQTKYPVLVAEDDRGRVVGWAGLSSYRMRDCYAGIAEFSIYLDENVRGRGIGRDLLEALVNEATALRYWKLVSRIFPFNTASRALCRSSGFREVGLYESHAQLDGRWLDVVIVERLIPENMINRAVFTAPAPSN